MMQLVKKDIGDVPGEGAYTLDKAWVEDIQDVAGEEDIEDVAGEEDIEDVAGEEYIYNVAAEVDV